MTLLLNNLTLSADEQERVAALHHTYGFEVLNTGVSGVTADERSVVMCYWVCKRGVRQSAVFPNHEAAWRDALRVHEEAVDAVKANPGVTRVKAMPADESAELSRLKRHAEAQGYTFGKGRVGEGQVWKFNGMTEGGHDTHAKAIRGAIKHWARRDPEAFCKAMNLLGEPSSIHDDKPMPTLTAADYGVAHKSQVATFKEVDRLLLETCPEQYGQIKALEHAGYQFHFTQNWGWKCDAVPKATGSLVTAVKAAWQHALENGGNESDMAAVARGYHDPEGVVKRFITAWDNAAKTDPAETSARAAGWTNFEDSEDASLLVVAHDNRDVHFTGPEAWEQAYQWEKDNELWNGVGQPPVGTTLWITPHNTLWGFPEVGTYLCEVLAYRDEHVWLKLLSDLGHDIGKYTTTRIDKVDVKVWKGNKDA